jgi:hypothetical protein
MVNASSTRPAGGEYGDVRAIIDKVKLNAYLANSVPAVTVPVTIKQFKVRHPLATVPSTTINQAVPQFGQVRVPLMVTVWVAEIKSSGQSNPTYFLTDARSALNSSRVLLLSNLYNTTAVRVSYCERNPQAS